MKPVRVYFVCKFSNYLHLPFRKKKQPRLKLTLHKLRLIAMWRDPYILLFVSLTLFPHVAFL
ncbi:hypothetical protein BW900_29675 [Bacillus mycoides]|uniref:Uncharacterized protein n=1 Tax=Bacillus mycoides TaxID=1405 RepID=A0A1S9T002_BACMY|nr:hypothetical protein BW900_29675 [Bacillus mycoides]